MKINKIQINGFGKVANKTMDFSDGINLIHGNNESGKSTTVYFIKSMFYGINKNKAGNAFSEVERFKPWKDNDFSGKIEYVHDDKKYLAYRDFNRNNSKVFDEEGNEITALFNKDKSRGVELGFTHLGVDEETFFNSVFITQGNSVIENDERKSVIQKITNIIQSGDESVSYDKAKQKLHKILLDEVGTERTHNKPINVVTREIDTVERMKDSLISNKAKKENIIERQKNIVEKIQKFEEEHDKVKKVFEVKDRYAKLVAEREKEHEISLKLFEKEKEEKLEVRKKAKYSLIILVTAVLAIISAILIYLNLELFAFIPAGAIIISGVLINKLFSMDITVNVPQDLDVTKENLKRKERKELEILNKSGISEKLTEKSLSDVKNLISEIEKNKNDLKLEEHKLAIENEAISEHMGRLNDLEEQLSDLYEKEENIRKLEFSINMAKEKLDEAYEELKSDIVPHIEESIKTNIATTTNGNYLNVIYNDRLGLVVENTVGETVTIDKLSIGTIDQMYLGFRFAIAEKINNAPIFLDETFAYYDDERLENILNVLKEKSKTTQIFIMTCSDREKRILEKLKIKYNEIEM